MAEDNLDVSRTIDVNDVHTPDSELTDVIEGVDFEKPVDPMVAQPAAEDISFSLLSGTQLQGSKYIIEKQLGQGGFGITYAGIQTGLRRPVAIKEFFMRDLCSRDNSMTVTCLRPDEMGKLQTYQDKFLKEARVIADMSHTNIVKIIDVFRDNNTAYYVMEHISGGSLQDYVEKNGPLPERKALKIIRQVGDALAHVHEHNILHLDIKPANIMLREDGTPVLIDFGISKHYGESGIQTTTTLGGVSRGYAPMEQYLEGGVAVFSPATDVYSLGATLLYLLTGQRPPEAQIVFNEGLPPLPKSLSESTREAITAAMRPQRTERPQSVAAFLAVLGGEQVVVDTDKQIRQLIEQLEIQGEYKEAYLRCMECLEKGIEVEFAQKKCEYLIPMMRKKNKTSNRWMYIIAVLASLALLTAGFLYGILSN